jgi:two-component system, NarL family, nitrate/nitrite response regulator NarL
MPKKRVFVVDDSPLIRSLVRRIFESEMNYEIAGEAENGCDAVANAPKTKPDLIVLDLSMPVMSGLDAAPLLRKVLPETQLILFTVHQGKEIERLAGAAGIHAVVSKDKAASDLITHAHALMSRRAS